MPIDRVRLQRLLPALGFVVSQTDHEVFELSINGKPVARTKLSRGSNYRSIDEPLLAEIARQIHISRAFLYELVRGTKTPDDYLKVLREQKLID